MGSVNKQSSSISILGPKLVLFFEKLLPAWIFYPLLKIGTAIAIVLLPRQRLYSKKYLQIILGRSIRGKDLFKHFYNFAKFFVLKLQVSQGKHQICKLDEDSSDFAKLATSQTPLLLGTFHVGHSDLLGYLLSNFDHKVHLIRNKTENSLDTDKLEEHFNKWVSYIWVNQPEELIFKIKDAIIEGKSIAMMCDRIGFSSKEESFFFLGAHRQFPFTIYHLSFIFKTPVAFCWGVEEGPTSTTVHAPDPFFCKYSDKTLFLNEAKKHFQEVLNELEQTLVAHPYTWFNFLPLNPISKKTKCS